MDTLQELESSKSLKDWNRRGRSGRERDQQAFSQLQEVFLRIGLEEELESQAENSSLHV